MQKFLGLLVLFVYFSSNVSFCYAERMYVLYVLYTELQMTLTWNVRMVRKVLEATGMAYFKVLF